MVSEAAASLDDEPKHRRMLTTPRTLPEFRYSEIIFCHVFKMVRPFEARSENYRFRKSANQFMVCAFRSG
jgi:hypothetical protein